ncbi:MAG: hypothetical protein ACR2QA_15315 [Solirubrobacteraceae bacterium]
MVPEVIHERDSIPGCHERHQVLGRRIARQGGPDDIIIVPSDVRQVADRAVGTVDPGKPVAGQNWAQERIGRRRNLLPRSRNRRCAQ